MEQEPQIPEEHHEQEIALIPSSQRLSSLFLLLWPMILSVMMPKPPQPHMRNQPPTLPLPKTKREVENPCIKDVSPLETARLQGPRAVLGAKTLAKSRGAVVIHARHALPQPLAMMRPWRFPQLHPRAEPSRGAIPCKRCTSAWRRAHGAAAPRNVHPLRAF